MRFTEFQPGHVINKRHKTIEIVGAGGMGTVVKAKRLKDGKIVAVKFCHLLGSVARRRFAREVRIMQDIDHPHVVPVLASALKHDPPYFVMPFAEGTCASRLAEFAADEVKAVEAFLQLCAAVQAIHSAGAVHRDIKPGNVLILDEHIALSDLGLAKRSSRDTAILTTTRDVVGTEDYLAPEQRMPGGSRNADQRTDIYQLGKTFYQLLTGLHPVLLDLAKVPPGLAHVVRKATRDHPDERYQSVGELMDAVKTYQRAKDPEANPVGAFEGAIERLNEQQERGEYEADDIRLLKRVLGRTEVKEDAERFLELFDRIPAAILEAMASAYRDEFGEVMRAYVHAIDDRVGQESFSYAEHVARRMWGVFQGATAAPELRAMAVESLLMAAVRLNRFAAMDSFNTMLVAVKEADALAVREVLEKRRSDYESICEKVSGLKLHPTIRELRDELAKPVVPLKEGDRDD